MKQYIYGWWRFFDFRNYSNLVRPLITKNSTHSAKIRDSTFVFEVFLLEFCVR